MVYSPIMFFKQMFKLLLKDLGYEIRRIAPDKIPIPRIPDAEFYSPLFSPWNGFGGFKMNYDLAKSHTIVSPDRCYVLYTLALQAAHALGEWYECGVYKGGTAMLLAKVLEDKTTDARLHLFDTFEGMPETIPSIDLHQKHDFSDTSFDTVKSRIVSLLTDKKRIEFHKGLIPETFKVLQSHHIAFAHIDVDIYQSVMDCCSFIYPRLQKGGFMVFDDYGFPSCPGARLAVDRFFKDKPEKPLVLPTGQAIIFKSSV